MQHCDKVMKETGEDWKVNAVISQLTSEEVSLSVTNGIGWNVIFETEPNKVGLITLEWPSPFIPRNYCKFSVQCLCTSYFTT